MNEIEQQLTKLAGRKVAVICVGNRLRGDDAFGPLVADLLGGSAYDAGEVPENVIPKVAGLAPDYVIFVDAADMGAPFGKLRLIDSSAIGGFDISTHAGPLSLSVKFLEMSCNCKAMLLAAQPRVTDIEAEPSPEIVRAASLAAKILKKII